MKDNVRSSTDQVLLHQAKRAHPSIEEQAAIEDTDMLLDVWIKIFVFVGILALIAIILFLPPPSKGGSHAKSQNLMGSNPATH